jgi:hypothetical protein
LTFQKLEKREALQRPLPLCSVALHLASSSPGRVARQVSYDWSLPLSTQSAAITHTPTSPLVDRLTGIRGCGVGRRTGRPSACPVVGPHSHMVLGIGVQASDPGNGVQPCSPHSVSSCLFVTSFPVAYLKRAECTRVCGKAQDIRTTLGLSPTTIFCSSPAHFGSVTRMLDHEHPESRDT